MAQEDFRLTGAALVLGHFTMGELAKAAGVKANTAASWRRRHVTFLAGDDPPPSTSDKAKRGRPKKRWRVRPEAVPDMQSILEGLRVEGRPNRS